MMVFNGVSIPDTASKYSVTVSTVNAILKRDDVRRMQYELACKQMRDGCVKAARLLVKQLDDENQWIAQNAARTILQWNAQEQEKEDQSITVTFDGMVDPDKVVKKLSDGALVADGDVQ